jgi:hypothetical protein
MVCQQIRFYFFLFFYLLKQAARTVGPLKQSKKFKNYKFKNIMIKRFNKKNIIIKRFKKKNIR